MKDYAYNTAVIAHMAKSDVSTLVSLLSFLLSMNVLLASKYYSTSGIYTGKTFSTLDSNLDHHPT